ncbi:MAG: polysaccharide deacetylase family protein [Cytophagales bacterium]|nr:polysaccharide deacetylase family protein [Cytophaga sp.]
MTAIIIIGILTLVIICFQSQGVPVLLFHQVNQLSSVSPDVVKKYFRFLKEHNYNTLTLAEADLIKKSGKRLPRKTVIITFDDGYYDNFSIVYPMMKEFNIKATFFINTLFIKDTADRSVMVIKHSDSVNADLAASFFKGEDCRSDQYMTWAEMKEMNQSSLADFQCHSHKHGMVFSDFVIRDVITKEEFSSGLWHVFNGKPKIGYPVFRMRGETSARRHTVSTSFLEEFQTFYAKELSGVKKRERVRLSNAYMMQQNKHEITRVEDEKEYIERIQQELTVNKDLIIKNLKIPVNAYAWPYGHKNQQAIPSLKKIGFQYFLTCKKGTNTRSFNTDFIYRIELRKPTFDKLKWFTRMNANLLVGIVYRFIS